MSTVVWEDELIVIGIDALADFCGLFADQDGRQMAFKSNFGIK